MRAKLKADGYPFREEDYQEGGRLHHEVIEGGHTWKAVQRWRAEYEAEQSGDTATLERIEVEREAEREHTRAKLAAFWAAFDQAVKGLPRA